MLVASGSELPSRTTGSNFSIYIYIYIFIVDCHTVTIYVISDLTIPLVTCENLFDVERPSRESLPISDCTTKREVHLAADYSIKHGG